MVRTFPIPDGVREVLRALHKAGQTAYVVGGAVRDTLRGDVPKDWDVATSATPTTVQQVFERTIPVGIEFGTVAVPTEVGLVEVTTYRKDGRYVDGRRPEDATFSETLEEDLVRRDFTINAMALTVDGEVIDPHGGQEDLQKKIIRAVGEPRVRFSEDALRMMRAFRFAARFGFQVEPRTFDAAKSLAETITRVSMERIFDELIKILVSDNPRIGLDGMMRAGLLPNIIPELAPMVGFDQRNKHHLYDLWNHTLHVVSAVPNDPSLRMAALLHDVGKPKTQTFGPDGYAHYYGHADVGADMANQILQRLKSSTTFRRAVVALVKHHMFPEEAGPKAVRKMLRNYGETFVRQFLLLRNADHRATGRYPGDWQSRLWKVVDEVLEDGDFQKIAVNGHDIMRILQVKGRAVGEWKARLEELILEDPSKNNRDYLLQYLENVKER